MHIAFHIAAASTDRALIGMLRRRIEIDFVQNFSPKLFDRNKKDEDYLDIYLGMGSRTAVKKIFASEEFDIIIADTGGGISGAEYCADLFDMILITSEQSKTSVRAAEYAAQRFSELSEKPIRLVICSFDLSAVKREQRAGIIEMIDESSLACLGVVPYDKTLQKNQDKGKLPAEKSLSAKAYTNIASRIGGNEVPLFFGMNSLMRKRKKAF